MSRQPKTPPKLKAKIDAEFRWSTKPSRYCADAMDVVDTGHTCQRCKFWAAIPDPDPNETMGFCMFAANEKNSERVSGIKQLLGVGLMTHESSVCESWAGKKKQ